MKSNPYLNKTPHTDGKAAENQHPANLCSGCIYNQPPIAIGAASGIQPQKWLYNGANRLIVYYLNHGWLQIN